MSHWSVRGEASTSAEIATLTNLTALAVSAPGEFIVKTGVTTFANVAGGSGGGSVDSVTGTADRITIGGTAADPIIDIASTYVGQASITTLGTITTGVWTGTTIAIANGGTGATAFGANRVPYMNAGNTALTSVSTFLFDGTSLGIGGTPNVGGYSGSTLTVTGSSPSNVEIIRTITSGSSNVGNTTFGTTTNSVMARFGANTGTAGGRGVLFFSTSNGSSLVESFRTDEAQNVGIGTGATISARLHVISTTEQLRLGYDSSNYVTATISSAGNLSLQTTAGATAGVYTLTPHGAGGAGTNRTLSFGTAWNNAALWLYTNGASTRYGWGMTANQMQFFSPTVTGDSVTFNKGGDLQAANANEYFRFQQYAGATGAGMGMGNTAYAPVTPHRIDFQGVSATTGTAGVENILRFSRIQTGGVSYPEAFAIGIGRYSSSGLGPDTRVDFSLKSTAATDYSTNVTVLTLQSNGNIGIGTTEPTHSLTIPSTGTGLALFNTVSQATNYERFTIRFTSNVVTMYSENAGTGVQRNLRFGDSSNYYESAPQASGGQPKFTMTRSGSSSASMLLITNTSFSGSTSAIQYGIQQNLTVGQSSTAGYTIYGCNITESSTGSGAKRLVSLQVGSADKFVVENNGRVVITSTTEQFRSSYDVSNYWTSTTSSAGATTFDAVGASASFIFSDDVSVPDEAYGSGWNGSLEVPTKNAVYDKIEASLPTIYKCRVYQTGATALTTSWVSCAFAAEDFDNDTMHDNATNNTRITFTHAGTYMIGGVVGVASNAVVGARIRLDGTTEISAQVQGNSNAGERACVSTIYTVTAGQYVELQGYANTLNTTGDATTNFWAYLITTT